MRLVELSSFFPSVGLPSGSDRALGALGAEPGRYMGMSLVFSGAAGAVAAFASLVWGFPFWVPLVVLALTLAFMLYLPKIELGKRGSEIACSMPFFLRSLGMLLEMGLPFRKAMEAAAYQEGALHEEISKVLRQTDEGMGLQKALSSFASSSGSLAVKRAVSQMVTAYESGASGREMKRIGDELLSLERHRLKEHAAKSALFGLMFVMSSAVMPTFFMVYAIAGGKEVGRVEISVAMLLLFPAIGALLLLLSKSMMPRSAFSGYRHSPFVLAPAAAFAAGFALFPGAQLWLMAVGAAGGLAMAWKSFSAERKIEDIEANLPDALFCAAGMPRSARPEMVFRMIEDGGFGGLSGEAAKTRRQMEMNVNAESALEDLAGRNRSPMLERACRMLLGMVETSSLDKLNILAEDMIGSFQDKRERGQLFSMQKYTLVLGALLMPLIMKMALGLLAQMEGMLGEHAMETAAACASLVPPYIVIYSIISGMAIADAEGKGSAMPIYSVGLAVAGLLAFHLISF